MLYLLLLGQIASGFTGVFVIVYGLIMLLFGQGGGIILLGLFLLFGVPFILESLLKNKLNDNINNKVGEEVKFSGSFVKSENQYSGKGYLAVTSNKLVFLNMSNDDVYSFNLNDIEQYIIGHKSTNNFLITDNAIIQGGKRVVEIQLTDGTILKWRMTASNFFPTFAFEKSLSNLLGSSMDKFKVS
ncbi:hypothetical protein FZC79_18740 [Rossellomorea vietnamensis]|uniref:GRAM domain-containing protein n=1 Tax=Rossellomorea vietnamensis TaxID=218284 RepID=A0A5D4K9D5_9BACI|nr:hypothetical protein [Rossellomorea vietnamensis]TYR73479.1 hypothetical protein FZC79_18740 [Rossellomorea vietnamensis]